MGDKLSRESTPQFLRHWKSRIWRVFYLFNDLFVFLEEVREESVVSQCLPDWHIEFAEQVVGVLILQMPQEAVSVVAFLATGTLEQELALIDWLLLAVHC